MLPSMLEDGTLDLDGHELQIIDVGQGDTEHSSIVYAPAIGAIVAGDVVYNQVHMMTAETDAASRDAWIANLDAIAALNPPPWSRATNGSALPIPPRPSSRAKTTCATSAASLTSRGLSKASSLPCWSYTGIATIHGSSGTAPGKPSPSAADSPYR